MLDAYSIYDKKVSSYLRPAFAKSIVEITRQLEQVVKQKDNSLALYPHDFALYKVGLFDEEEGVFVTMTKPEFVVEISSFVKEVSNV